MSFEWAGCTCLWMVGPQFAYESEIRPAEGVRSCSTLIDLGCVWLRKSIFEKYFIFRKYYFWERKMYSGVWLRRNSFYEKSIPVFGSYKHFTENDFRFTENHFQCLFPSNILRKMKFIFYKKSFLMFGLWIILQKITISSTCII